jgi:hypothetical protein
MKRIILFSVLFSISIFANTINVPDDYPTIQEGIDWAESGDTVLVAPGTYNETINLKEGIILHGSGIDNSIIQGSGYNTIYPHSNTEIAFFELRLNNPVNEAKLIKLQDCNEVPDNIFIHNNKFDFQALAAIYITDGCQGIQNLVVENNIFTGTINNYGSVIFINNGYNTYIGNNIINNLQFQNTGGAIFGLYNATDLEVSNNIIKNTSIIGSGYAPVFEVSGNLNNVSINNNLIYSQILTEQLVNAGESSFAINIDYSHNNSSSNINVLNNSIYNHPAGVRIANNSVVNFVNNNIINCLIGLLMHNGGSQSNVDYNNIWGNGINYSDADPGSNDISYNPQFTDSENGDFSLQSNSPCIDAGDPSSPQDPDGTIADIGAFYYNQDYYGCTNPSSCNYNPNSVEDDGSCAYFDCIGECGGGAIVDECGECAGDNSSCSACMDSEACNYDSEALFDDGSCVYGDNCNGCTNPDAMNYEEDAVFDDGSCIVPDIIVPDDYSTIQGALNADPNSTIIYVRSGTYYENIEYLFENTSPITKQIIGENKETTIIDGSDDKVVFLFKDNDQNNGNSKVSIVMKHLTIQNGNASGYTVGNVGQITNGGGIYGSNIQLELENIIIQDNQAIAYGGGVYLSLPGDFSENIDDYFRCNYVKFYNNMNHSPGSAMHIYSTATDQTTDGESDDGMEYIIITNSTFEGNQTDGGDGTINLNINYATVEIYNTLIINNNVLNGKAGAIRFDNINSHPIFNNYAVIKNSVIAGNFSTQTPYNITMNGSGKVFIINSIITNDQGPHVESTYTFNSVIQNLNWQSGTFTDCLDIDPLYTDPENGNYTLSPTSPCIDSGADYLEFAGEIIYELSPDEYEGFAPDIGPWETSQMFVPDPVITNIEDIGDDQGGRVYLHIQRSFHDKEGMSRIESYQIDRLDDDSWVGVATQNAYNDSTYRVEVTTLIDSSSTSDGRTDFRVIANMEEGNFLSGTAEGYSVDNIHPEIPDNVTASIIDNDLTIEWASSPDVDFSYSRITDLYHPQVYTVENTFNASFVESYNEYFVNSVDTHDNISENSETVSAFNLNEGANLISLNILPNDASPEYVFGNTSYGAISEGVATVNQEGSWIGSLTQFNACDGYWVFINDDVSHTVIGESSECDYSLHEGNNLKSYPCNSEVQTSSAINNECISGLIGEGAAGINIEGNWFGSLQSLQPGDAYWITSDCEIPSFEFNCSEPELTRAINNSHSKFPEGMSYAQSSSQGFYFIENIELSDREIESGDWVLAYHNDQLIGARMWEGVYTDIPLMGKDLQPNTASYLNMGNTPTLKVLTQDGELYDVTGELEPWSEGCMHVVSSLSTKSSLPTAYRLTSVYPNPFNPQTNIVFDMPKSKHVNLIIYDLLGRQVEQLINRDIDAGSHKITWDAEQHPSGIYILQFNANNINQSQKIVLVK